MKNLNRFEAFKLNKNQMNAVSGGKVICFIHVDGETISVDNVAPGIDPVQASKILQDTYQWADSISCTKTS